MPLAVNHNCSAFLKLQRSEQTGAALFVLFGATDLGASLELNQRSFCFSQDDGCRRLGHCSVNRI